MTRSLALAGLIALTVAAPTASAATAPARVAFSVVSESPHYGGGGGAYTDVRTVSEDEIVTATKLDLAVPVASLL